MSTAPASPSASTAAPAASSLVDDIGRTPLLRLDRVADDLPDSVAVYGKAEHLNPGGSVKDRPPSG
jgi:cysteine synthase (EC 2.5.1.47)